MNYSTNPIINRFLQLTLEEGKSVRGVALSYDCCEEKKVIFSLSDGTNCQYGPVTDNRAFSGWWKDTSELVKKLRNVDLSPVL